jgi:outer membrane protein OmpA-like peptidoglycan-associated protein
MGITIRTALCAAALLAAAPAVAQDADFERALVGALTGEPAQGPAPVACFPDDVAEENPVECGQDDKGQSRAWFIPTKPLSKPVVTPAQSKAVNRAASQSRKTNVRSTAVVSRPAPRAVTAAAPCALDATDGAAANMCATFELGSARLTAHARGTLDTVARVLMTEPKLAGRSFLIEGHADATGDPARNRALSAERAQAVADYLKAKGLSADRLKAAGFGSDKPISGRSPEDPSNRRVQVRAV